MICRKISTFYLSGCTVVGLGVGRNNAHVTLVGHRRRGCESLEVFHLDALVQPVVRYVLGDLQQRVNEELACKKERKENKYGNERMLGGTNK